MLGFVLVLIMCATLVKTQEGEIIIPDNKTICMNDMIDWCDSMQYPQQGAGLVILSIVYEDPNGYYRVFCSSDSGGTNCTRNTSPWFTCSPDHVLTYKGQLMTNATSKEDVDDDICATADKAFNELYVQNLSSNKNISLQNEVQKGMEAFFDQIAMMEEQINLIKNFIRSIPYIGDLFSIIDEEEDVDREDVNREYDFPTATSNDKNQTSTDQMNQASTDQMNQTTTDQINQASTDEMNQTTTDQMNQATADQMNQTTTDQINEIETE